MKLRPPATPLITCDPYFSVWSPADRLTDAVTMHWTTSPVEINGKVTVDGVTFRFIGNDESCPAAEQISFDMDAFSSVYVFACGGVQLRGSLSHLAPRQLYER